MQSYSETLKMLHVFVLILQGIVWLFDDRFVGLLKLKSSSGSIHNGVKSSAGENKTSVTFSDALFWQIFFAWLVILK